MADATLLRGLSEIRKTNAAAVASGEIHQLTDGRAGVYTGLNASGLGDVSNWTTFGQFTVTKTASVVIVDGGEVWWDHSANAATFRKVSDRDFYLGRAIGDAASAATTVVVDLNVLPRADIDLARDGFQSVLVGTAAAGAFGYPVNLGGALVFELTATNEAQKVDALSVDGFALAANAIVDGAFRVLSDGAGTVVDVSIGIASATHASDADSIAESVFLHLDANNANINAESDDGTTEVAATDTTTDYTEGSAIASRVHFTMDMRDPASVKIYVNGVRVLSGSTFNIAAAAGPLFLLVHVEKSVSTDTYKLAIDWLKVRFAEQ